MADSTDVADQSAETSSAAGWLEKLTNAVTTIYTADKTADAARDNARAAAAANAAQPTTQPNWLLIGGIGAAVLLIVGVLAFRK